MKKIITAALLLLIAPRADAKRNDSNNTMIIGHDTPRTSRAQKTTDTLQPHTRFGVGFTPVTRSTIIDGVAVGIWARPLGEKASPHSLAINGVNIEANPIAVFLFPYALVSSLIAPFTKDSGELKNSPFGRYTYPTDDTPTHATVRGISISSGFLSGKLSGIGINMVCSMANEVNGVEISGMTNIHYSFKGVLIAALRNKGTKGKGVQIGIINECKEGKVVQIGLLNTIGKRRIPLVNFSLKRKKPEKNLLPGLQNKMH